MFGRRLVFIIALVAPPGCAIKAQVRMSHEPRFTTYAQMAPAARPGYPSDFGQVFDSATQSCGGPPVSGYDFMLGYDSSGAADPVIIQRIQVARTRESPCGSKPASGTLMILEIFRAPAVDVIASAFCGESRESDRIDGRVAAIDRRDVGGDVLAQLAQITSGQNVVILNGRISDQRFGSVQRQVEQGAQISWRADHEYDGCDLQNPSTTCGAIHCMTLAWQDSIAAVTTSRSGGR